MPETAGSSPDANISAVFCVVSGLAVDLWLKRTNSSADDKDDEWHAADLFEETRRHHFFFEAKVGTGNLAPASMDQNTHDHGNDILASSSRHV
jgi:hypothetical protein